jgi:hypothetical protein
MVDLCREIVNVVGEHESDNPDSGGKTGSHRESQGVYRASTERLQRLPIQGLTTNASGQYDMPT